MAIEIQLKRGVAANWTLVNPTLADGEIGIETDTRRLKLGDGLTAWNALPYYTTGESTVYDSGFNYLTDAIVGFGGKIYISLQDNNLGKDPVTEILWWEEFSGGAAALVDLTDVDATNIAIGKILQVGADGVTHEYVDMPSGGLDKTFQTLTEDATITFNAATSVNGSVTLTASRILGNITNAVVGEIHCVKVIQGGSGGYALTYGNQYYFSGGILPILSATVGAVDLLFFEVESASIFTFKYAIFDRKTP